MAVSSDGRLLVVAGSSVIQIFETKTQNLLGELKGHPYSVERLVFAPCGSVEGEGASRNGYTLLSTSRDDHARSKVILVWGLDSSGCQIVRAPFTPFGTGDLTESAISAIAKNLEQDHGVTADEMGTIRSSLSTAIEAIEKQHRLKTLPSISGVLPHYNSSDLFCSDKGGIRALYVAKNESTQHGMRSADVLPQIIIAQIVSLTSSDAEEIQGDGKLLKTSKVLQGHTDSILSVAFSPDGKLVASAS
jgi:WD40 repeat protein